MRYFFVLRFISESKNAFFRISMQLTLFSVIELPEFIGAICYKIHNFSTCLFFVIFNQFIAFHRQYVTLPTGLGLRVSRYNQPF